MLTSISSLARISRIITDPGLGIPAPYCVHLKPPSLDELKIRLQHRGTESPKQLNARLDHAQVELDDAAKAGIWDQELVKVWTEVA